MENIIFNDLQQGFVFYPNSGQDYGVIPFIMNYFNGRYNTFVFCDAGRALVETLPPIRYTDKLEFMENKIGLSGLHILSINNYTSFTHFADVSAILNKRISIHGAEYEKYIDGIFNRQVSRYVLKYQERSVILYFFRFESAAVLEWLTKSIIGDQLIESGLIMSDLGWGWTSEGLETILIDIYRLSSHMPSFLLTDTTNWNAPYEIIEDVNLNPNKLLTISMSLISN